MYNNHSAEHHSTAYYSRRTSRVVRTHLSHNLFFRVQYIALDNTYICRATNIPLASTPAKLQSSISLQYLSPYHEPWGGIEWGGRGWTGCMVTGYLPVKVCLDGCTRQSSIGELHSSLCPWRKALKSLVIQSLLTGFLGWKKVEYGYRLDSCGGCQM